MNNLEFDRLHIWHPYTSLVNPQPCYQVSHAEGVHLTLADGQQLVDGMSSWWAAVHGYNVPALNQAAQQQLTQMSHVMFGGLTHQSAIDLARKLVALTPEGLECVFLADSGSVSVEVAMKVAIQYWLGNGKRKQRFISLMHGYHGDTFGAMSLCDPINGMHRLFSDAMANNLFAPAPQSRFGEDYHPQDTQALEQLLQQHHHEVAALVLEPVVQGAGGMRIYHPDYLRQVRALCDQYQVLLIADEIATGFGRTGKLFACEWAEISPDILCVGKALTGGYVSLAAMICSREVATAACQSEAQVLMHGPTFMGNPLACAIANASLELLLESDWRQQVKTIESQFKLELLPLRNHTRVADVRVLGAIGVVECTHPVDMAAITQRFVELGVWIRPFGKLIYLMPPFVIHPQQLQQLITAINTVLDEDCCFRD